jgi:hypothetical protein
VGVAQVSALTPAEPGTDSCLKGRSLVNKPNQGSLEAWNLSHLIVKIDDSTRFLTYQVLTYINCSSKTLRQILHLHLIGECTREKPWLKPGTEEIT